MDKKTIFVTGNGEHWEPVVRDGLGDPRNYGARTFTVFQGALYIGTANPYYGAQLWKITDTSDALVLTGKLSEDGTCLTYAIKGAANNFNSGKMILFIADYDETGKMLRVQEVKPLKQTGDITVAGNVQHKAFLFDRKTLKLLCDVWDSNG